MKHVLIVAVILLSTASEVRAQSECWIGDGATCNAIAQHAQIAQAAAGIALTGGNPVPGASSTLGMRIGRIPRVTASARLTGAFMNVQSVSNENFGDSEKGIARSLNVDAALGVLSGWTLAPTIGGFASLDLLASAGKLTMPDEFTKAGGTWAIGARLGILRESFTAPGVSLTGMYRKFGDLQYGSGQGCELDACESTYTLKDNSVMSARAVVGKRLFVLGANVGVGYDKYSSQPSVSSGSIGFGRYPELEQDRFTAFANVTWTMLLLNAVLEGGYQRGGDDFTAPLPAGHRSKTQDNTYYGSLALRLAL